MTLTPAQIKELKEQLKEQIQHLPQEQKTQAEAQIEQMSPESLEIMLQQQQTQSQKIFRLIIQKQIPSVQLDENEKAIAVLSTKSISKGHVLIIPKSPVAEEKKLPQEAHDLSEKISKKLIQSLKANSTNIVSEKNFGEIILNIIPIYDKPLNLNSPREDIKIEELESLKKEINVIKIKNEPEKIKKEKKPRKKILKLRRRVP